MAKKLSDTFLELLGGALEGASGMTPEVKAELALRQSASARDNLSTLATMNEKYNAHPAGFVGPLGQGSFTPPSDMSRLVGISPGTSFEPIPESKMVLSEQPNGKFTPQTFAVPRGTSAQVAPNPLLRAVAGKGKQLDKEWADLETAINPGGFRNRTMQQNLTKKQSAEAVITLLNQAGNNPNAMQSPELAQSVATLLQSGGGGHAAQEQLNALTPHSLKGDIMKQLGYFANQPYSLDQQPFFDSLRQTALREGKLRGSQILQEQISRLPKFEHLRSEDPGRFTRILKGHNVDETQIGSDGAYAGADILGGGAPSAGSGSAPMLGGADPLGIR